MFHVKYHFRIAKETVNGSEIRTKTREEGSETEIEFMTVNEKEIETRTETKKGMIFMEIIVMILKKILNAGDIGAEMISIDTITTDGNLFFLLFCILKTNSSKIFNHASM